MKIMVRFLFYNIQYVSHAIIKCFFGYFICIQLLRVFNDSFRYIRHR